jgi:hypothetical protein
MTTAERLRSALLDDIHGVAYDIHGVAGPVDRPNIRQMFTLLSCNSIQDTRLRQKSGLGYSLEGRGCATGRDRRYCPQGLVTALPARAGIPTSERPIGSTPKLGAEPGVWTERMLAALVTGVNGGREYRLTSGGPLLSLLRTGFPLAGRPCAGPPVLLQVNHRPESRMREIRTSGSEGGGVEPNRRSLPLSSLRFSVLLQ